MTADRVVKALLLAAVLLVALACAAWAEIPRKINYQGLLTDADTGEPMAGSLTVTFRIFDVEEGGSPSWTETQSVSADSKGVMTAILGRITPIDVGFDGPMWLEVEVNSETLSPRREMVSVPYAFHATDADSLGGMHSDSFSLEGHDHNELYFTESELGDAGTVNDPANPVDWSKLKNIPPGFADGADDVGGAGDGHSLDAADGDPVDVVYVDSEGLVGIGTTSPERRLHVFNGSAGSVTSAAGAEIVVEDNGDARINLISPGDQTVGIEFGDANDVSSGWLVYNNTDDRFRLGVNNADRLTIDNQGEVGLGTGGPSAELHVYDDANSVTQIKIENPNTGSSSSERLSFVDENGDVAYIAAYDEGSGLYSGSLVMANNRPGGNLGFYTGGDRRLWIDNFGTTRIAAPGGSPLQCQTSGAGYIEIETDNNAPVGLRMRNAQRDWYLIHSPGFDDRIAIYDANGSGTRERLVVDGATGYVGIHNTSPGRHLDITGRIRATHNESGLGWTAEFRNSNPSGNGLYIVGNNVIGSYVGNGAGLNCNGLNTGGYFRATATGNNGQRSIWCENGAGGSCYVCYRSLGGIQYDVYGNGGVGLTVPTSKGQRILTAPQSPEAWVEDYGSGEIMGGFCHVDLDPLYADCVTIDEANPVKVFVQMTSPVANQYYVEKGTSGFDVIVMGDDAGTVDATFDYRVVAARKDREQVRFAEAESLEEVQMRSIRVETGITGGE